MSTLASVVQKGVFASRPAASIAGLIYYSTDTGKIYRDNGSSWDDVTPTASLVQIGQVVVGSPAANITFSGIPGTYTNLKLLVTGQTSNAAAQDILMQFNSDTAAHYDWCYTLGGSVTTYSRGNTQNDTALHIGSLPQSSLTNKAGSTETTIHAYANTSFYKNYFSNTTAWSSGTSAIVTAFDGGEWQSTAAITSITLTPAAGNFVAGTIATLYGML